MIDPIEVMARAICCEGDRRAPLRCQVPFFGFDRKTRVALASLENAGYRLAEREPSKEMVRALARYDARAIMHAVGGFSLLWDALPTWGKK